jgi:hypothetical protein
MLRKHVFIVPELNPVQPWLRKRAIVQAECECNHLEWVIRQGKRVVPSTEHDVTGIRVLDFNPSLGWPAAFSNFNVYAQILISDRESRLLFRLERAYQPNKRDRSRLLCRTLPTLYALPTRAVSGPYTAC